MQDFCENLPAQCSIQCEVLVYIWSTARAREEEKPVFTAVLEDSFSNIHFFYF